MEWIRTADLKKYDVVSAFKKLPIIDWVKSGFKISKNDIVYIYVGIPYSKIMYKTICIEDSISGKEMIDDREYWVNQVECGDSVEHIRLKLLSEIDNNKLSLFNLTKLGLVKARIQGAYKSANYESLFEYIHENENSSTIEVVEIEKELNSLQVNGLDRDALVKVRINQGIFRKQLLEKYEKCCLCRVYNKELLIASHIKPWSVSDEKERVDVNNGLLLCPNHDHLFDGGWISFEDSGEIMISENLDSIDRINMNVTESMKLDVTEENKKYLKYHRENIFKK